MSVEKLVQMLRESPIGISQEERQRNAVTLAMTTLPAAQLARTAITNKRGPRSSTTPGRTRHSPETACSRAD